MNRVFYLSRFCFLFFFACLTLVLSAQNAPAGLKGKQLRDWLQENYFKGKHHKLGYTSARRYMYNYIDNHSDTLECVYSGYKRYWKYGGTETNPMPINCEHTIPQSFFRKSEPERSDLHHLFPSYVNWNSTRSNYPFAELSDSETEKWMINTTYQRYAPTSKEYNYSKYGDRKFEPRDVHKGDLARAIFYFYTMYPNSAGDISKVADPQTLYKWHIQDPVSEEEKGRNQLIEKYQGDRNPYIDHPDYIARAWGFNPSSVEEITNPNNDHSLLANVCSVSGEYSDGEWISNVSVGDSEFHSGAKGYNDFTQEHIAVKAGEKYKVELTPGFGNYSYSEYWGVWVDFENNGDFSDSRNLIFQSSNVEGKQYCYLQIPEGTKGLVRMRIIMQYGKSPNYCTNPEYGAVSDFCLDIKSNKLKDVVNNSLHKEILNYDIFPNPVVDNLNVRGLKKGDFLYVVNLNAQVLKAQVVETENVRVDTSDLPKGVYFINIQGSQGVKSYKLVK
ncbi:MAG: endonuclease [Bacteroidales bacterium]